MMNRMEESVEAILTHLHTSHEGSKAPRFRKGQHSKQLQTVEPSFLPMITTVHTMPSALTRPTYRIIQHFTPSALYQPPINIVQQGSLISSLQSYECVSVTKNVCLLNCGSGVVSSALKNGLLAVSCVDTDRGLMLASRSFETDPVASNLLYDNVLTIFAVSNTTPPTPLLHVLHHHCYATNLQWLECEDTSNVYGVLACVFVDGSFEVLSV